MTIKAIIFDLGGVIIELDFSIFFQKVIEISPLHTPHTSLYLEFWRQSDWYHQGKMTNEEFYNQTCELLKVCFAEQDEFFDAFNSVISHINEDVFEFIKKLKATGKYKILIMSNVNESHWNYIKSKNWGIQDLFEEEELLLSYVVKMTKPYPRFFQLAISEAGCKPEEIVFVDDGLNNVRGAQEMHINAIKYTTLEELIEEFKQLGISV
jgi:epoxide hydrolase-like predicted phosphatase